MMFKSAITVISKQHLQLIHGDLCFNNILCDPVFTSICLIDPKVKPKDIDLPNGYGDSRYDFAKFLHSLLGNYDSIVNNMFKLSWSSSNSSTFIALKTGIIFKHIQRQA